MFDRRVHHLKPAARVVSDRTPQDRHDQPAELLGLAEQHISLPGRLDAEDMLAVEEARDQQAAEPAELWPTSAFRTTGRNVMAFEPGGWIFTLAQHELGLPSISVMNGFQSPKREVGQHGPDAIAGALIWISVTICFIAVSVTTFAWADHKSAIRGNRSEAIVDGRDQKHGSFPLSNFPLSNPTSRRESGPRQNDSSASAKESDLYDFCLITPIVSSRFA